MKKQLPRNQRKSSTSGRTPGRAPVTGIGDSSPKTAWLKKLFGIDPRSLALFRVLAGLMLLIDLAIRATDLRAMYTDAGMFPREEMHWRITSVWNWSLHFGSGAAWFQAVLFGIAGILAVALLAGFATRIATIGSWLMLVSIQHRAPAILSGAEILLRMLLFWAMFLPLERAWSLDRWRAARNGGGAPHSEPEPVVSIACAAILLQMGLMYLFSAISKSNGQWVHGEALAGILSHDFYGKPAAGWLLRFPELLKFLTWGTLTLEWAAPLLLFFPKGTPQLRLGAICGLALMHVGIGACLEVGLFSYVSLAGLSLFLPAEFWNGRVLGHATQTAPVAENRKESTRKHPRLFQAAQGLCVLALIYVLALNLNGLSRKVLAPFDPEDWRVLRTGVGLSQSWGMFGEIPSMDGWYVARAKLKDGSTVDLLRNGAPLDWTRPKVPARMYPNHYWHKLFREMCYFDDQGFQVYRAPVAEYLCRNWDARHPAEKQVTEFEFIFCVMEKERAANTLNPRIYRRQLVRLDYSPGNDRPVVSGYTDAPPGAGVP